MRRLVTLLTAADLLLVAALAVLAALALGATASITSWRWMVGADAAAIAAIAALAWRRGDAQTGPLASAHDWYVAPAIFLVYKHVGVVLRAYRTVDHDDWLIAGDRWLLGADVATWLGRIAHPAITEVLQIAYTSFYLLFLVVGFEVYRYRPRPVYRYFAFACTFGFLLTYVAYAAVPAIGPRFTLQRFSAMDRELPGLLLTPALRRFVNAGGSIPAGVDDRRAAAAAQRDVFPSGHTAMALALVAWAWRYRLRVALPVTALSLLIVVGALYLRYHYAVDLVAGAVMSVVIVVSGPVAYRAVLALLPLRDSRDLRRLAAPFTRC